MTDHGAEAVHKLVEQVSAAHAAVKEIRKQRDAKAVRARAAPIARKQSRAVGSARR